VRKPTATAVVAAATNRGVLCPCCGHDHWRSFDEGDSATVVRTPKRSSEYGAWLTGFIPVHFYCDYCGFVRLHVVSPDKGR
jgi:hypothetical protein